MWLDGNKISSMHHIFCLTPKLLLKCKRNIYETSDFLLSFLHNFIVKLSTFTRISNDLSIIKNKKTNTYSWQYFVSNFEQFLCEIEISTYNDQFARYRRLHNFNYVNCLLNRLSYWERSINMPIIIILVNIDT